MKQTVQHLDRESAAPFEAGVLDVWVQAFGAVDDVREWSDSIWNRHRSRADYRLAVAEEGGRVVGFAWGYTGQLGQYWQISCRAPSGTQYPAGWVDTLSSSSLPLLWRRAAGA